jgi:hypothetical protein
MPIVYMAALTAWLAGGTPVDSGARANFPALLVEFGEGATLYGYPDNEGNITIGRGNEIPNYAAWQGLDWTLTDGVTPATFTQVQTAWLALSTAAKIVKANGPDKWPGGGHYESYTSVRATQASIDALIQQRLDEFDSALRAGWEGWDDAPPAAQSVLMRLAWACGTVGPKGVNAIGWPKLHAFWVAKDWAGCATECSIPALDNTEPGANERAKAMFLSCVPATADTDPAPPSDT